MTKRIFLRIALFGAVIAASTTLLVTVICSITIKDVGIAELLLSSLPYVAIVVLVVLAMSVLVSYAITKSIVKPIEKIGESLDSIDEIKTDKELQPFVDGIKAQNQRKKLLDKQKKQFTANVSHELKTPLTSIAGYAELIESGIANEADVKPFAHTIRKQALRLVSLAEDIIKLSQLEEDDTKIIFEEVDLCAVVNDCAEALLMNTKQNNITINTIGTEEPIFIKGNKSLIEELVYNLCDNAIRYNVKDGKVDVSIKIDGDKVNLLVADTGIGIPDKYKERIFERFFRVDKSRSKETGGTGLGLAIVKHICEVHSSDIIINSKENEGTSISITFDRI